MINTKELEKRWFKYKTKGLLLVGSILMVLFLLIYGGYYILYKMEFNINLKEESTPKALISEEIPTESNSSSVEEEERSELSTKGLILAPTIPVVDLESEKLKDRKVQRYAKVERAKTRRLVKAKATNYLTASELAVINGNSLKTRETKKINLNRSSNNYLNIMKDKFKKNKNPREALLIAEAYYRAGDYSSSEKWSFKANSLNKNLDESWLLFAKSKEKLGNHKEALKVLVAYYRTSKSPKAKNLIEKIKSKSI